MAPALEDGAALRPDQAPNSNGRDISTAARFQSAMVRWLSHSGPGLLIARMSVVMLKLAAPLSLLVVLRRSFRLNRMLRREERSLALILARSALEIWALFETLFWVYFKLKKRSLEARRAYQPSLLWKPPGERRKLLHNFLANVERIHDGNMKSRTLSGCIIEEPTLHSQNSPQVRTRTLGRANTIHGFGSAEDPTSPARSSLRRPTASGEVLKRRLISAPSVENFLRFVEEP
ncbi:unnamed protein product, partial [Polarella glacialis]